MRVVVTLALALALAPALVPVGAAADTSPVLVERTDSGHLNADVGAPASATFSLFNLNPADDFYVSAAVTAPTRRLWVSSSAATSYGNSDAALHAFQIEDFFAQTLSP